MRPIVCLYCEGTDAKLAVVSKDKNGLKILRTSSLTITRSLSSLDSGGRIERMAEIESQSLGDEEISFDSIDSSGDASFAKPLDDSPDVNYLHSALGDFKISSLDYIPIVTEPIINFHHFEGPKESNRKKMIHLVKNDLLVAKGITVESDMIDYLDLNEKTTVGIFLEGEIPCVGLVNQLANFNRKRFLKIPTIKTAELSLAYYVAKTTKFFPEDYTLIIYIGKEYSKLLFLEGQKLKHIGSTLDIGTKNLHTYDVYFSKILLEMENGGIQKLDNIILCGEDRSENLILSFFGTFPEANVTELKFENLDTSVLSEDDVKNLALYAIPISAAVDYYDELSKLHVGVNFLPRYIQENQKTFQFAWHGYAIIALLFPAALLFTILILNNMRAIKDKDGEIERLQLRQVQNQALVDQITPLDVRINTFDATQTIIDSAAIGAGLWNMNLLKIADFIERRRNFWITKIEPVALDELLISGYSLSRSVLTEFTDYNKTAILKNINFEPLREKNAFSFNLNYKMMDDTLRVK